MSPTLVRLSSSRPGVPEGETVDLSAEVSAVRPDGVPPTGQVAFRVGSRLLGTARLDERGRALLPGVALPTGVHALVAAYDGDAQHAAATSAPLPQAVVAPAAPVMVAVAAPLETAAGVRLEAELLDPRTGRLVEDATGRVLFVAGTRTLGEAAVVAGQARVVVERLPDGPLRVVFPGDRDHAAASCDLAGPAQGPRP